MSSSSKEAIHLQIRPNNTDSDSLLDGPPSKSNGALPKINNQETVIMRAASQPENGGEPDLMMMHNTRIFYFEKDEQSSNNLSKKIPSLDEAADIMTQNINDMLMTPKYRTLSAFYVTFHLLDHAILVSIILSLFTGQNSDLEFAGVFLKHWELFGVIALEMIYEVLEYNVRVWILNRVSFYFVFILYGLYVSVLTYTNMWDLSVTVLLSTRFASFLCELAVDFFIDLELDHDLREKKIHSLELRCISRSVCGNIGYELEEGHDLIDQIPFGWRYKGSIYAWTPSNAFILTGKQLRRENLKHRYVFEVMVLFTILVTIPVTIIVGVIMVILNIISRCCVCCKNVEYKDTILAECTKKPSW